MADSYERITRTYHWELGTQHLSKRFALFSILTHDSDAGRAALSPAVANLGFWGRWKATTP